MIFIAHQQGHKVSADDSVVTRSGRHVRPARIDWIDVIHTLPPLAAVLQELIRYEPPLR